MYMVQSRSRQAFIGYGEDDFFQSEGESEPTKVHDVFWVNLVRQGSVELLNGHFCCIPPSIFLQQFLSVRFCKFMMFWYVRPSTGKNRR